MGDIQIGRTATDINGTGWTCTLATLSCTRTTTLGSNASYPDITLTVDVAANAPTSVTNTATVSGGGEANTATANNTASDLTTINSAPPNLSLVKRITAINGDTAPFNSFNGSTTDPNGNGNTTEDTNWPTPFNIYLRGAINAGVVKPADQVEYTTYFLNSQGSAINVTICSLVPANQNLVLTGYNVASPHPTESGALSSDTAIALASDGTTLPTSPTVYLTNSSDSDRGRYYPPNDSSTPSTCKKLDALGNVTASGQAANTDGAVVVEVVQGTNVANQLPPATAPGTPSKSYGFIRFKAQVK